MRDWLFDRPAIPIQWKRKWKNWLNFTPLAFVVLIHVPCMLFSLVKDQRGTLQVHGSITYTIREHDGALWCQDTFPARGRPFRLPIPYIRLGDSWLLPVLLGYGVCFLFDRARSRWKAATPEERWLEKYEENLCPDCGYDIRATPDRCPECSSTIGAMANEMRQRVRQRQHSASREK